MNSYAVVFLTNRWRTAMWSRLLQMKPKPHSHHHYKLL